MGAAEVKEMAVTDQETQLLEKAAQSAGIELIRWNAMMAGYETSEGLWNPLLNDGDALRLAVDLGLDVHPVARTTAGQACSAVGAIGHGRLSEVVNQNDSRAATRRAIVMAAASIRS